jgi:Domain of unknown function (DUF4388)
MFIQGSLALIGPASLLQMICQEQRSVSFVARYGEQLAQLTIVDGLVVAAHCGELSGYEAAYQLVTWGEGLFHITPIAVPPAEDSFEMTAQWEELLLEAARRRDELGMVS